MNESAAVPLAVELLASLLGESGHRLLETNVRIGGSTTEIDAIAEIGDHRFVIEYKGGARAEQVRRGLEQLRLAQRQVPDAIPLLVVPFMGDVGKLLCQEERVSWLDLSGNALIDGPGLRINVQGNEDLYRSRGRPASLFAPASSRIARALLHWPDRWFSQTELAEEVGVSPSTVSVLLPRYEEAGFVGRRSEGRRKLLKARDPGLLMEVWREAYDFSMHDIHRGHIAARSGMELLHQLAETLEEQGLPYAATGLGAAWLLEPFAPFRLVTVYLAQWPSRDVLGKLMFREEAKGANVWLVLPRDEGVFYGSGATEGVRHVGAVQTYLDLKAQPERSAEAAEEIKRRHLPWGEADGQ